MKKIIVALAAFLAAGLCAAGVALVVSPGSLAVHPVTAEAPCPVVGCASGSCHGFDDVPEPDGVTKMSCPEAGCASAECHAWETLTVRYHQASDASLNLWILMPAVLVVGLMAVIRKVGRP